MKTPKHAKLDEDNVQSHDFALLVLEVKIKNILKQAYTLGKPSRTNCAVFLNIVQKGGGVKPMFKNFVANILLF